MKSGMIAAEVALEALAAGDTGDAFLSRHEERIRASWIGEELRSSRNFHAGFDGGFLSGMVNAAVMTLNGGRGLGEKTGLPPGHTRMRTLEAQHGASPPAFRREKYDGKLTFDRESDVFRSGTRHEPDQVPHLRVADTSICAGRCATEYGNPCTRFCPAAVYEMVDDAASPGRRRLQVNFENCVHCKTCDIMDPYQIIDWVPPEGGDGPRYVNL
jgi:electron-transferring-flavoprotein dehydrogenase